MVSKHSAREKSIRHGHPSTLHLWWARRPPAGGERGEAPACEAASGRRRGGAKTARRRGAKRRDRLARPRRQRASARPIGPPAGDGVPRSPFVMRWPLTNHTPS
ncbi:MAG TPA: DUF1156 domain-containing protein [Sumerlaeia bacterium]|nr:DUF1156 domain-containing protein [Sumerlaeia bacterium]